MTQPTRPIIQILPSDVAAQIAAGEVIERPASVVKELLENALDAGARRITVEARGGGIRELKIQDDGGGIPADQIALAFERHATSKLRHPDDLWAIRTLGFRGEALPSIASVAQVICITRTPADETGTELRIAGGEVQLVAPRGCSVGTSMTVRNLFYNTPVRREFLRADATEMSAISAIVQQYALAYPTVRFTLLLDGRLALQTSGSGNLRDVMVELYGIDVARQMLTVATEYGTGDDAVSVQGLISPPGLTRGSRSYMHMFVNGRAVQPRGALSAVVSEAYHTLLMKNRHPMLVLSITLNPAAVDVNIHPTKSEVKFRPGSPVLSVLGRAVRDTLVNEASVPTWDSDAPATNEPAQRRFELRPGNPEPDRRAPSAWGVGARSWTPHSRWDVGAPPPAPAARPADPTATPPDTTPAPPDGTAGTPAAPLASGADSADSADVAAAVPDVAAAAPDAPAPVQSLPPLRVVGQVGLTYIVAESPDGMYLIDQHAAHERITYEHLMQHQGNGDIQQQELLLPQTVTLPPAAAELLTQQREALQGWGFQLEPWGEGLVRVRAVPATIAVENMQAALLEIADHLAGSGGSTPAKWREAMLITLACHNSVRAGQVLSLDEMRDLLQQLEACHSPRTCPHGRPTMVLLTPGQLEKQFGRIV